MIWSPSIDWMRASDSIGTPRCASACAPAFEGLFDQRADADHCRPGGLRQAHQAQDGRAGGQEVVDDQHPLAARQVFGRDDQLDHATFGVGGRQGQEDLVGHGDRLVLAGIDHRQPEMQWRSSAPGRCRRFRR